MCELKDNGRKNVTSQNIRLLEEPSQATRFISPGNRSLVTPKNIFLGLFNDGMLSMIAEETSAKGKCHSPDSAKSTTTFDTQDVVLLIAAIVECCGNQYTEWKKYVEKKERVGLSINRLKTIRKHFSVRPDHLFNKFNENLKSQVHVGGHSCIDETMLKYTGDCVDVVVIPRKPKDTGIRLYLWCFGLTTTNNPVVFHIIPDIVQPPFEWTPSC